MRLLLLLLIFGCSSLSKLEKFERPIIVVAKSNTDESRNLVVRDRNGRLLKITEASFVYTYNPGDTLK